MDKPLDIERFSALSQIEMAEELQTMWLIRMAKMFADGTITSTDMATLSRVLLANGWTLDKTKLPKGLRDKLTEALDLNDPATREELGIVGVVGRR